MTKISTAAFKDSAIVSSLRRLPQLGHWEHHMNGFLDWLAPRAVFDDDDHRRRAQIFVGKCCFLAVVTPIRAAGLFAAQQWTVGFAYVALFLLSLFLLRLGRRGAGLWWPMQVLAFVVFGLVSVAIVNRGGIGATLFVIHALLPLTVTYVLGLRAGIFWWGGALVFLVGLSVLQGAEVITLTDRVGQASHVVDTVIAVVAPTAAMLMSAIFEWSRRQAMVGLQLAEKERADAEASLLVLRADKMASVGSLAAGFGHEVNNPLTYIQGNIDFVISALRRPSLDPSELTEILVAARQGSTRIADICRALRVYSYADADQEIGPTSLNDVVKASLNLTRREIEHRASLRVILAQTPQVLGNEAKLTQVLVNLLMNAAHAVEGRPNAEITIRAGGNMGSGWIEISDTGPGIPRALRRQIFDPFFTTKNVGEGTGLGLSVSKAVVESLGGELSVLSTVGVGSTFRFSIPALPGGPMSPGGLLPVPSIGLRRIVLIEDDLKVARAAARMLEPHSVITCASGAEAIEILTDDPTIAVDLIVCDVMMQPTPGWEVYSFIEQHVPELARKFIFVTGGAFSIEAQTALRACPAPLIHKPIVASDILGYMQ